MDFDAVAYLEDSIRDSEFLKDVAVKPEIDEYTALSQQQISQLEKYSNICEDWSRVRIRENTDISKIRGNFFYGKVCIGALNNKAGIYHCTLKNTYIEDNVYLNRSNIDNYIVRENACIAECSEVSCEESTVFGNGIEISIAIETGGREVLTFAEMNIETATRIAGGRDNKEYLEKYSEKVKEYLEKARSNKGIIGRGAKLLNSKVQNAYIGMHAAVDNAMLVKDTTVLSSKEEKTVISHGAYVVNSIVQWGCEITSFAIVDGSVLTEHSHAERHGKVTDSIIGPNTGVAEGEVTASLVGPFVGFHHQALLIAAFWPEGKGNIAHGANVGSNHPSRAPDQEVWPGEGLFVGLDAHIKFPADFTRSPYTIIAAGVLALAQRMEFPFSLINVPAAVHKGISPAFMEIKPGWVLSDNLFMIKRNEGKYQKRNKAKRSKFVFEVFRPDIIDLILDARERLGSAEGKALYTKEDIKGLGKNYLMEENRIKGIETYTFHIRHYALSGLKKKIEKDGCSNDLLTGRSDDERWEHERKILEAEFGTEALVAELLDRLATAQEKIAQDVQWSKEKDDKRGMRIIEDYASAHTPASEESFVKQTWDETNNILKEIEKLKSSL